MDSGAAGRVQRSSEVSTKLQISYFLKSPYLLIPFSLFYYFLLFHLFSVPGEEVWTWGLLCGGAGGQFSSVIFVYNTCPFGRVPMGMVRHNEPAMLDSRRSSGPSHPAASPMWTRRSLRKIAEIESRIDVFLVVVPGDRAGSYCHGVSEAVWMALAVL